MGESSLEPLVRAPTVLGELPTPSHRSGVWGHKCDVWTDVCHKLRYSWPMDNRYEDRPSHPVASKLF